MDSGSLGNQRSVSSQTEVSPSTVSVSGISSDALQSVSVYQNTVNNRKSDKSLSLVDQSTDLLSASVPEKQNMEVDAVSQTSSATESSRSSIRMTDYHKIKLKVIKSLKKRKENAASAIVRKEGALFQTQQ